MPLPGYSPDLMPVEALWHWLREDVTYHHCHASAEDLTRRVADSRCVGRRLSDGKADTEDGIAAEPALVGSAVKFVENAVGPDLIESIMILERLGDLSVDCLDRLPNAFAAVSGLVIVAQLDGLTGTGRGARRNSGAALRAAIE